MESDVRQARHNLRGRLNALKLCVSALEMLHTRQELLEFLAMIDQAADRTIRAVDELDAISERNPPPSP
jgi:hypothetical protein